MSLEKNLPKRKAAAVEVPDLGKNAAERKRVLNVLAQRRYRQRRKEHVKKLEEQIAQPCINSPSSVSQVPQMDRPAASTEREGRCADYNFEAGSSVLEQHTAAAAPTPSAIQRDLTQAFFGDWSFSPLDPDLLWDSCLMLPSIHSSTPDPSAEASTSNDSMGSTTSPSSTATSLQTLSPPFSGPTALQFDFPDEANLKMLELDLLRAGVAIARRMHLDDLLWQMEAISPYTDPSMLNKTFEYLPVNLRPTKAQQTIQHHPFLDLLPWPTVRNKLLAVFSQPVDIRPPVAASPTAILDLVYDIEDSAEGVRVWGDDPCSDLNWEVGQKVFERWWWAFDREIINRSNRLRRERGAPSLRGGFIVGEIA